MAAETIAEVVSALDDVVERALRDGNRIGYFAAVYRTVTVQVRTGLEDGFFDDADRMEQLAVRFANRFLDALDTHHRAGPVTRSWQAAFLAAARVGALSSCSSCSSG